MSHSSAPRNHRPATVMESIRQPTDQLLPRGQPSRDSSSRSQPSRGQPSRDQPSRGQVEPIPALAAVVVVGLSLSLYATAIPTDSTLATGHEVAQPTLSRVYDSLTDDGMVNPNRLASARDAGPDGYIVNVTLTYENQTLHSGPRPPASANRATRQVSVEHANGSVVPGRLTVVVWS